MQIGVKPGQWGWSFGDLVESWRVAEGSGFDLLGCFDHVSSAPDPGTPSWDAPTLLTAMAAWTRRIRLAVHVVNASLRHPFLLAGQLAVVQATSGSRLEVGLGAGSHYFARYDHRAVGIPFPPYAERMRRLEACCRVLPPLWRGEEVSDEELGMRGASLGAIGIVPPPIVVGGSSDRALEIALRHADGWHGTSDVDPERFSRIARLLDERSAAAGRAPLRKGIQVRAEEPADARRLARRYREAGADQIVFVLRGDQGVQDLRRLAEAVLAG